MNDPSSAEPAASAESAAWEKEEAAGYLREKLVTFQKQIATLKHQLHEQEEARRAREKELLLQLLDLADAFASFEESEKCKAALASASKPDPARQKLVRQVRGMQKKLEHILKGQQVVPLELDNNKAQMELCEVVSTEPHPDLGNETIVTVLSRGYLNQKEGKVLRKAKVVTVLNQQS
jgi:molecular chaperone GrpE (heat shock protein)